MRGKITKQELNENLIEDIVFQEDLQEAIDNVDVDLSNYTTKEDLQEALTDDSLLTNDKSLVGAINELFQSANNGKQLIADAIGNELINGNSTFKAMSEAILALRSSSDNETDAKEVLYNMMIEDGYNEATSEMTVDELIELLDDSQIDQTQIYVEKIYSGGEFSYVLKSDGTLWACGDNTYGELGLGHTNTKNSFTQVKTNVSDVKEISCGYNHVFMIKNDGTVWACGLNDNGQLGLGDKTNRNTFTQVPNMNNVKEIKCGAKHTILLKNDGTVWGCGQNTYCQLGLYNVDTSESTTFISLYNGKSDAQSIAANKDFSFILSNTGKLYGAGNYFSGQLGTEDPGTFSFAQVQTNVKTVIPGDSFTYIIKNDNTVWSTGRNKYGQLGLGNTTDKNTFTKVTNIDNVKEICCGDSFSVILKNDGTVWSCGANYNAQLGYESEYENDGGVSTFTKLTTNNTDTKDIVVYGSHGLMLKNDNNVYSWGFKGLGTSAVTHTNPTKISSIAPKNKYSTYEMNRLKLYYYLLDNEVEVTESMDIGTMLDLLVDNYINNMINEYYNNLKLVLIDEGVNVTEEDDMNSLITKVDEEFTDKNNKLSGMVSPAGTAVASDVLSGKTFINSTGKTVTGSMLNQGSKTITPSTTNQSLGAGYYSGITINGDSDLKASNIVKGVNIFGITGTANSIKTGTVYPAATTEKFSKLMYNGNINLVNHAYVTLPSNLSNSTCVYLSTTIGGVDIISVYTKHCCYAYKIVNGDVARESSITTLAKTDSSGNKLVPVLYDFGDVAYKYSAF